MSGENDSLADAGMLDLFRMEVETHVSALEAGLLSLENGVVTRESIEPLMRAAHSIKGAARIMGLNNAVSLAHVMEDIFVAAQEGRRGLDTFIVDLLLKGVDFFKRLSKVAPEAIVSWLEQQDVEIEGLRKNLADAMTGEAAPPSPMPPPPTPAVVPTPKEAPPPAAAPREEDPSAVDSAVLVTAETLNRLMGLAGECMVESHRLQQFTKRFLQLKDQQFGVRASLAHLSERMGDEGHRGGVQSLLFELAEKSGKSMAFLGETLTMYEEYSLRAEELTTRLYNEAIAAKMRPFRDGIKGFPRLVRDLARQLGKKIRLKTTGESTRVDREILVRLEAPLTHLLRNACDHGIESPADRFAAGKADEGTIVLEAAHKAGMLFISVSDDGRGIDPESVRRKVIDRKLAAPDMAERMTEAELMEFLFLPGFSTAKAVTEISGRGVGMDVVQSMIQEVGGSVRVNSKPGKGSAIQLQLPLTLSVMRALIVDIAGQPYAFHLSRVDRILKTPRDSIQLVEDRQYIRYDGENIGLAPGYLPLGLEASRRDDELLSVVVISDRLNRYGLVVDQLRGERELVVRPLDPRLGKIADISSAAVLEDGTPVLIVDVEDVVRSIDHLLSSGASSRVARVESAHKGAPARRILVVDDSITVREVERRLLENHGYKVDVAVDGMDGWNRIREGQYDLIISDIDMPRMNGIEMVARIKNDPSHKELPVMIVSYKDREEDRLRGLEAGANYYLTKSSFHDESLLEAVRNLLGEV
ncbi:MAG TPA: hybrid sensor histidine kinase/response regulator [Verrucomicrobia bacterium]|nr:MAG: hybrid sensor histidine kinase/response regulator [Lentisphaerae bacterium GWF2_57_35]HBA85099.1 hybrid sensor histidine kinase/response regulator [Verrucomicrobiota bacterium]